MRHEGCKIGQLICEKGDVQKCMRGDTEKICMYNKLVKSMTIDEFFVS